MVIAVSACLLCENCKYNGGNNYSEKVRAFCEGHEVIHICPEVMGGHLYPSVKKPKLRSKTDLRWLFYRKEDPRHGSVCADGL